MKFDVVAAVEACYATPGADGAWLQGLLAALAPLDQGAGLTAQTFSVEAGGRLRTDAWALSPSVDLDVVHRLQAAYEADPGWSRVWDPSRPVEYALRRAAQVGMYRRARRYLASEGFADALGLFAAEPDGRFTMIVATLPPEKRRLGPRTIHQLELLSAHIGSGMRLRRAAAQGLAEPEAILDRRGRVLHATDEALASAGSRRTLADAVRRSGRARGALRATDPEEALQLWQGLVDGSWSLVDHTESDGKRLVLARRNAPGVRDPKALSARERAVLAFVAMGHPNKLVAYQLGLSPSAVSAHLRSAQRKLGVTSRAELVHVFASLVRAAGAAPATVRATAHARQG